jgi:hypothetical protein
MVPRGVDAAGHVSVHSRVLAIHRAKWTLLAAACAAILLVSLPARADLSAEGDILYAEVNASSYRYSLDLQNNGTTTIGTFWYSWVPGEDFLPSSPTNVVSPAGWTSTITGGGSDNGYAIEWTTSSPIAAGSVVSGFGFDSPDAPTVLLEVSPAHPTHTVGTTFVYQGAALVGTGFQFSVEPVAHPWSNPLNPLDVNRDGAVTPLDALLVIDYLNANGSQALPLLPLLPNAPPPYVDTSADDHVSPLDALLVIDALNAQTENKAQPDAATFEAVSVPEPSTAALAALGFAWLAVSAVARRLRKNRPPAASTPLL